MSDTGEHEVAEFLYETYERGFHDAAYKNLDPICTGKHRVAAKKIVVLLAGERATEGGLHEIDAAYLDELGSIIMGLAAWPRDGDLRRLEVLANRIRKAQRETDNE